MQIKNISQKSRNIIYWLIVLLFFMAAVSARIYGAWAGRYINNPDCGIVALMAKHVAEGGHWPVFFYGQAYMGSLEPLISALLCKLFGVSGFMVCLGTALAAILTLPIIFLWGKDAGGKSGALTALALCVIGPYYYFMFQFAPRGGYMVMLFLGLLCMWLSARIAYKLLNGFYVSRWTFLLLGIIAGLGMWTTPLIISALLASGCILIIGLRKKIFSTIPIWGIAGVMLGSLPFWIWNIKHGGLSFDMLFAAGGVGTRDGFIYLWQRWNRLIGLSSWPSWLRVSLLSLYLLAAIAGLLVSIRKIHFKQLSLKALSTAMAGLFLFFSVLFFVRSSFATMNTARYLVPMIPALAVLIGNLTAWIISGKRKMPAFILPVILFISYLPAIHDLSLQSAAAPVRQKRADQLKDFLNQHNITAVYSHFMDHSLNFAMRESAIVTILRGDRYPPYRHNAELADNIGYLNGYGHIDSFIKTSGGKMKTERAGYYRVSYDFEPPSEALKEINLIGKCSITDNTGKDYTDILLDRNADTIWCGNRSTNEYITVTLHEPVTLRRLRLIGNGDNSFPRCMKIEVKKTGADKWSTVYDTHYITGYFWSGLRPYWWGKKHRQEYSFNNIKVDAIRLQAIKTHCRPQIWQMRELQLFAPGNGEISTNLPATMEQVVKRINELKINCIFADRWESNKILAKTKGKVWVELNQRMFGDYKWQKFKKWNTALLSTLYDAPLIERELKTSGIDFKQEKIGARMLFYNLNSSSVSSNKTGALQWTGYTVLSDKTATFDYNPAARFHNGVTLLGIKTTLQDDCIIVSYYWNKPINRNIGRNQMVFVHFVRGDNMFQDDYPLAGFMPAIFGDASSRNKEVYFVTRKIYIPDNVEPGEWEIRIGIYDSVYGGRSKVRAKMKVHKRAVIIPAAVTIK